MDLSELAKNWPAPIVSRGEVGTFSGGLLHPRTLANIDAKGLGPKGRIRVGRRVGYRVDALIEWMEARAESLD